MINVVCYLLERLLHFLGDDVELLLALRGDGAAIVALLDPPDLLELLKDGPDDLAARLAEVARRSAVVLLRAEAVLELSDRGVRVEVDLAGDRRSARVPPVLEVRRHLLQAAGLAEIGPFRCLDDVVRLEVPGKVRDEDVGGNFTDVRALVACSCANH